MSVDDLVVGRVYFWLLYADDEFSLPIISTYQYTGRSGDEAHHIFRILDEPKSNLLMTDSDVQDLVGVRELTKGLHEWADVHPDRAS